MKLVRNVRACAETMEYKHSWTFHCGMQSYQYAYWHDSKELSEAEEDYLRSRAEEKIKKLLAKKGIDTP